MKQARTSKSVRTVPFDAAAYLDDDETRLAYLNAVLADGDPGEIVAALGTIARARGMSRVARHAGLGRESLYKALGENGNPAFRTILGVAAALGYRLEARPQSTPRRAHPTVRPRLGRRMRPPEAFPRKRGAERPVVAFNQPPDRGPRRTVR